jgi:hypothetical protein
MRDSNERVERVPGAPSIRWRMHDMLIQADAASQRVNYRTKTSSLLEPEAKYIRVS